MHEPSFAKRWPRGIDDTMNTPRPPTDTTNDPLLQAYADADRLLGLESPQPGEAVRDRVLAAAPKPPQAAAPAVGPVPQRAARAANAPRWRWAAIAASVCTVSLATLVALRVQMESPPEAFVREAPEATRPAPAAVPPTSPAPAAAEAPAAQQKAAETRQELRRRESARRAATPAPVAADQAGAPAPAAQAAAPLALPENTPAPAAMAPPAAPAGRVEGEVGERRAGVASEAPAAKALQAPAPARRSAVAADSSIGPALHRAAETGQPEAVRQALAAGADVNSRNRDGRTALLEAVLLGDGGARHVEIVKLLLARGADPNLADRAGVTPLQHARQRGYTAMAQVIEEAGGR
jgi:hypothetical protein